MPKINWDAVVAVIAVLALVQPWVFAAYKKYFRPGKIEAYETGEIEVGFDTMGATIALQGTLRALDRDQFVKAMKVEIVRERDKAHHQFDWAAFRPTHFGVGTPITLELASGFMLLTSAARRYNVLFVDMQLRDEIREHLDALTRAFGDRFQGEATHRELLARVTPGDRAAGDQLQEARRRFHDEVFSRDVATTRAYDELQQRCYWAEGAYQITLRAETSDQNRTFSHTWTFQLTQVDAQKLRAKVLSTMTSALGLPARFPSYIAFARYK